MSLWRSHKRDPPHINWLCGINQSSPNWVELLWKTIKVHKWLWLTLLLFHMISVVFKLSANCLQKWDCSPSMMTTSQLRQALLHQKLYLARSYPLHYKQILNRNLTDWSKLEFCYPWRNLQHGWAKWLSLRNQVDLWGSLLTHNHWMKLFSERITSFVLSNLNNAKVFSKHDVKQAYWHVQLDKESSLLTTMIAPLGRYRWARLPFGLNVSSEIFHRKQNEALSGLNGVICVADDLLVTGSGDKRRSWLWSWAEPP